MSDVYLLTSRPGELPCDTVFEDGVIVTLYNQPTSRLVDPRSPLAVRSPFTAVSVDNSGERIALCDRAGNLILLDLTNQMYRRVRNMSVEATLLSFSLLDQDGIYAVLADSTIRCYNSENGDMQCSLSGHRSEITSLSQSSDGKLLLTASNDRILLWDIIPPSRPDSLSPTSSSSSTRVSSNVSPSFKRKNMLDAASGVVHAVIAARPGLLAAAFGDDSIVVWRYDDFSVVAKLSLTEPEVGAGLRYISIADDGSILAAAANNGCVYVWDLESQQLVRIIDAPPPATAVLQVSVIAGERRLNVSSGNAFAPAPAQVVMLNNDGRLLIVELGQQVCSAVLELERPGGGEAGIMSYSHSADGNLLAVTTSDGKLVLVDVPQAKKYRIETASKLQTSNNTNDDDNDNNEVTEEGVLYEQEREREEENTPAPAKPTASLIRESTQEKSTNDASTTTTSDQFELSSSRMQNGQPQRGSGRGGLSESSDIDVKSIGVSTSTSTSDRQSSTSSEQQHVSFQVPSSRSNDKEDEDDDSDPLVSGPLPSDDNATTDSSSSSSTIKDSSAYTSTRSITTTTTDSESSQQQGSNNYLNSEERESVPVKDTFRETKRDNAFLSRKLSTSPSNPPTAQENVSSSVVQLREGPVYGTEEPRDIARKQAFVDGLGDSNRGSGSLLHARAGGVTSAAIKGKITPPTAVQGGVRVDILPSPTLPSIATPLHDLIGSSSLAAAAVAVDAAYALPRSSSTSASYSSQNNVNVTAEAGAEVTSRKLAVLIEQHGSFPLKYRSQAWRFLLRLPKNAEAHAALVQRGLHSRWDDLESRYPVRDRTLFSQLQRCCSALSHWSPVFSELPFLPVLAFPFVKFFGAVDSTGQVALEATMAVLVNWCRRFVEILPHPPLLLLSSLHLVLRHYDLPLAQHLEACGADSVRYAWPLLRSVMSEVLTRDEWETLWDTLLTRASDPTLLVFAVVSYLRYFRGPLLAIKAPAPRILLSGAAAFAEAKAVKEAGVISPALAEICTFLRHQNPLNMKSLLKLALEMRRTCPPELVFMILGDEADITEEDFLSCNPYSGPLFSLPRGHYPPFLRFPRHIVDFQAAERKRIADEEQALIKRREQALALSAQTAMVKAEEEALLTENKLRAAVDARSTPSISTAAVAAKVNLEALNAASNTEKMALAAAELERVRLLIKKERIAAATAAAKDNNYYNAVTIAASSPAAVLTSSSSSESKSTFSESKSSSTLTSSQSASTPRAPLSPLSAAITSSPASVKKFKEVRESIKIEQEKDQLRQQHQQEIDKEKEEEEEEHEVENIQQGQIHNREDEKKDNRIRAMSALVAAENEHLATLAALQRLNGRAEQELNSIPPTPRIIKQYDRFVDGRGGNASTTDGERNGLTRLESGPAQHPQVVGPSRTAIGSPRGRYSDRFKDTIPLPFVGASVAATIHLGEGESEAPSPASTPPRQSSLKTSTAAAASSTSRAMPTSPLSRREMKILAEEVALHQQQSAAAAGGGRSGGGGIVIGVHAGSLGEKEKKGEGDEDNDGDEEALEGGDLE
jgi:hypothetical protein